MSTHKSLGIKSKVTFQEDGGRNRQLVKTNKLENSRNRIRVGHSRPDGSQQ